jgi:hypothetical protein
MPSCTANTRRKFWVTERVLGRLEFRGLRVGDWDDNGGFLLGLPAVLIRLIGGDARL